MQNSPKDFYNKILGAKGERLAVKYLKKQGYKILEKNYSCPYGEADVIAKDGEDIVFVEVKTRTSDVYGRPSEAVDGRKQDHYRKIAAYYLGNVWNYYIRFDVVEVMGKEVLHLKAAYR